MQQNLFDLLPVSTPQNDIYDVDHDYHQSLSPLIVTPVFDMYWKFAYMRQEIFFKKIYYRQSLTEDAILAKFKFTNAYRASDRVSQYLIKEVIYSKEYDSLNTFYRIMLFKLFNKIETWEKLQEEFGEIIYDNYNFKQYDNFLTKLMRVGEKIYSAAYIMAPGVIQPGLDKKHSNHLKLIELMLEDGAHLRIQNCRRFQQVFDVLTSYPMIGDFLGYQLSIDINYSNLINFSENEFVIPGPGALNGIAKCFKSKGGFSNIEIIRFMKDRQEFEFNRLGLNFKNLWGRNLKLIDCQNLFCEIDKYSRIAFPEIKGKSNRVKIKQLYKPHCKRMESYWYPPKWGINEAIKISL